MDWPDRFIPVDWPDVDPEEFDAEPDGREAPGEAARGDIPPQYARVESVTFSPDGRQALVTLLTNEEPYLYPYYVWCVRDSRGLWHETAGHN